MRSIAIRSPDGIMIAAYEAGNPQGPPILFIHGLMQCHLAWRRQFADPALAQEFRLLAIDLRGHGASDKPIGKEYYNPDQPWADDLAVTMVQLNVRRPVLVGWSYAGRVITSYLRIYDDGDLAGINFVGANTKSTDSSLYGPGLQLVGATLSEDVAASIEASRTFLHACFAQQPSEEEFAFMLAYNMMVPPKVRAALTDRDPNPGEALASITCPVLVTHGAKDPLMLPAMGEFTAAQIKGARLSLYEDAGHAPFYEDAPRFNRELAEFVKAAQQR
jgi:non-heme chloroperoxidase